MKILKASIILIAILFFVIFSFVLKGYSYTEYITNYDTTQSYSMEFDIENANVRFATTDKDQVQIEYNTNEIRSVNNPYYFYLDENTFHFSDTNLNESVLDTSAQIYVYIPNELKIDSIDIDANNATYSFESVSTQQLNYNGDNLTLRINNSSVGDVRGTGKDVSLISRNSNYNSFYMDIYSGLIILNNIDIDTNFNLISQNFATLYLSDLSSDNATIKGDVSLNLNIAIDSNYKINTDEKIDISNFELDDEIYNYTGDLNSELFTKLDLTEADIREFDISIN